MSNCRSQHTIKTSRAFCRLPTSPTSVSHEAGIVGKRYMADKHGILSEAIFSRAIIPLFILGRFLLVFLLYSFGVFYDFGPRIDLTSARRVP